MLRAAPQRETALPGDPSEYPFELAAILFDRLRTAKQELVTQWLERITKRVSIETRRIFPTHELLNHIPLLIEGVAGYLKRPERDIDSKAPVVAKAMELALCGIRRVSTPTRSSRNTRCWARSSSRFCARPRNR